MARRGNGERFRIPAARCGRAWGEPERFCESEGTGWVSSGTKAQKRVSKIKTLWYNEDMRKQKEEAWKKCPKCGKTKNQMKAGYNGSGSQRCRCKECGIWHILHNKPETERVPGRDQRTGDQNILRRSKRTDRGENPAYEQIQCDELDKKRARKRRLKSAKQVQKKSKS